MKRLLAGLALAAFLIPVSARADGPTGTAHWVWEPVKWRTQSTSFPGTLQGDSLVACGAAAARLDTTAAIYIGDWVVPSAGAVNAAMDSLTFAVLQLNGAGTQGLTDSFDSLYVSIQVSDDGSNWGLTTCAVEGGSGIIGCNLTTNAGGYVIDGGVANHFGLNVKLRRNIGSGIQVIKNTAPSWYQLFGWNYIRLITRSGTNTGCYSARFGHWSFN